jgi:hypothetical protein
VETRSERGFCDHSVTKQKNQSQGRSGECSPQTSVRRVASHISGCIPPDTANRKPPNSVKRTPFWTTVCMCSSKSQGEHQITKKLALVLTILAGLVAGTIPALAQTNATQNLNSVYGSWMLYSSATVSSGTARTSGVSERSKYAGHPRDANPDVYRAAVTIRTAERALTSRRSLRQSSSRRSIRAEALRNNGERQMAMHSQSPIASKNVSCPRGAADGACAF